MEIRNAVISDMGEIEVIYERARSFMKDTGNPHQWGNVYPSRELILSDIEKGELFVLYDDEIEGVFVFTGGADPTYDYIEGEWLDSLPYRAVHRVASAGRIRGFLSIVMNYCFECTNNIKIDTHEDNIPMQGALEKYGFQRCGIIYLENGEERIAYQMKKIHR